MLALLLAKRKADAALLAYPDAYVCGFDTIVECEDTILGKLPDLQHACEMLALCQDLDAHVTLLTGSSDTTIAAPMDKILPFIRAFCGNQL